MLEESDKNTHSKTEVTMAFSILDRYERSVNCVLGWNQISFETTSWSIREYYKLKYNYTYVNKYQIS